jgi:hypothetical protein
VSPRHSREEDGPGVIERLRAQLERVTAERDQLQRHLEARRELDAMLLAEAAPAADGTGPLPVTRAQGHRAAGRPRTQTHLRVVKAWAFIAALSGLGLRWRAARVAARVGLAALLTGPAVSVAAGGAAGAREHPLAVASAPGWHTTAVPIPAPAPAVAAGPRGKMPMPKLDAKAGTTRPSSLLPYVYYMPPVQSPPAPAVMQPSSASSSSAATPVTLTVSGTEPSGNIDLSGGGTVTLTLTASGDSGWVSWQVNTEGATDLDFSKTGGVLRPGQVAYVTVSVDPRQGADGDVSETFMIGTQAVTAMLPAPVPAVAPSAAATVLPSALPS